MDAAYIRCALLNLLKAYIPPEKSILLESVFRRWLGNSTSVFGQKQTQSIPATHLTTSHTDTIGGDNSIKTHTDDASSNSLIISSEKCSCQCTCGKRSDQRNHQKNQGHIMLSYNHKAQSYAMTVRDKLMERGHQVWMDIDQIASGGSTLESMSSAVEGSSMVLVFYSEHYKNSINCRAEAEYAFEQRKLIIPVQVEDNYKPTGWLGMLLGTKYRYNLSRADKYDRELSSLLNNIDDMVEQLQG